jgi:hypothetical protein
MALVDITQAAAILGVSDDTVRTRVESGELIARRDELGRLLVDVPDSVADARPALHSPRAQVERPTFVIETVHLRNLLAEREARIADLETAVESLSVELGHQRESSVLSSARERELIRAVHQGQALHARALGLPAETAAGGDLAMALPIAPSGSGEKATGGGAATASPWWRWRRARQAC